MLKLQLKWTSQHRTGTFTAEGLAPDLTCQAVRHDDVREGQYVFAGYLTIDAVHHQVWSLVGARVLLFTHVATGTKLFVYGQKGHFPTAPDSIGLPLEVFNPLWASVLPGLCTLEVKKRLFSLWAKPVQAGRLPQALTLPLDRYAEGRAPSAGSPSDSAPKRRTTPALRDMAPTRSQPSAEPDDPSLADFLFMSLYPEVAPLYRPTSIWAWLLWWENQEPVPRDGIPGFPDAATQRITPYGEGHQVELLDRQGQVMGAFTLSRPNGASAGEYTLTTETGSRFDFTTQTGPEIHYRHAGQAFSWDGAGQPVLQAYEDDQPLFAKGFDFGSPSELVSGGFPEGAPMERSSFEFEVPASFAAPASQGTEYAMPPDAVMTSNDTTGY